MLRLDQLNKLLAPLSQIGKGEKIVDVAGTSVTLRNLTPLEESEVQKEAPDLNEEKTSPLDYVDGFRLQTLARSIVQIGEVDFRNEQFIETGDVLPNGLPVKITKTEALLNILKGWSRPVWTKLFEQYGVLLEEVEDKLDKSLEVNKETLEEKKQNLESRLLEVNRQIELQKMGTPSNESV